MAPELRSKKDDEIVENIFQKLPAKIAEVCLSEDYGNFLKKIISECVESGQKLLLQEINSLKESNQHLVDEIKEVRNLLSQQKKNVNNNKRQIVKSVEDNYSYSDAIKPKANANVSTKVISKVPEIINIETNTMQSPSRALNGAPSKRQPSEHLPRASTSLVENQQDNNNKEDDFTPVMYRKRRSNKNDNIIRGTGNATSKLCCVESKIWIFLGRCTPSSTTDDVMMHLKDSYPDHTFEVTDLNSKGIFKSFKIGADQKLEDALYQPDFWPKGASVKRYFFRKTGASFNQN